MLNAISNAKLGEVDQSVWDGPRATPIGGARRRWGCGR